MTICEIKKKYPRTFHAPWSEGATSDDKTHTSLDFMKSKKVVITEKMDGENTTMTTDSIYSRSLDSANHYTRNAVKKIWGDINYKIPKNYRICGENLYAVHSIHYEKLPSYFMAFSVWEEDTCLPFIDTKSFLETLNLIHVPVLYIGDFDEKHAITLFKQIVNNGGEGIVIRAASEFTYNDFSKNVIKAVRKNHVTSDQHWMHKTNIKKNGLLI